MAKKVMFWLAVSGCLNTICFKNKPIEGGFGLLALILYAYIRKILKKRKNRIFNGLASESLID